MSFRLACALLLLAPSAFAGSRRNKTQDLPPAGEVLRRALQPSAPAYEGRVSVDGKVMKVHFQPPDRYRREILDEGGKTVQLIVSDGKTEWIYDKARKRVWEGEPAEAKKDEGLLKANYDVELSAAGKVARRAVWELRLRSRFDGALKRRLWVDQKTGMILRSESLGPDGAVASSMSFETVRFPKEPMAAHFFEFIPPRGASVVKRAEPDFKALGEAKAAAGVDPRTPRWLPSGYVFESLDVLPRNGQNIIHYRYSDGVGVLSMFQCPQHFKLDFGAAAGRAVKLASGTGLLARAKSDSVLSWSSGRSQFVLVGPVADEALVRIAGSVR